MLEVAKEDSEKYEGFRKHYEEYEKREQSYIVQIQRMMNERKERVENAKEGRYWKKKSNG